MEKTIREEIYEKATVKAVAWLIGISFVTIPLALWKLFDLVLLLKEIIVK